MKFTVRELPLAGRDKRQIVEWLFAHSPQGAATWLRAYDAMIGRLEATADALSLAPESGQFELEVRQVLFKTKRGRIYRAVFHLDGATVYVLRVLGPGQAPLKESGA